jgi:hypothetical protein
MCKRVFILLLLFNAVLLRQNAVFAQQQEIPQMQQEQLEFRRKVTNTVNVYNIGQGQLQIIEKTKELNAKRYDMARERFTAGKIDFLDYSVAQNEKDRSQIDFIQALQKIGRSTTRFARLHCLIFCKTKRLKIQNNPFGLSRALPLQRRWV